MGDIVFEKAKGRGGAVNRMSVYGEAASEEFFKKDVMRNFQNLQENICARISFLVFSCRFCGICKKTFFTEQHQTIDSGYSSINSSEGSIGKRKCKL